MQIRAVLHRTTRQENNEIVFNVARIFDRFYTQDKSRSKGSGIGLYLCAQFIEAMGGSIGAEINRNYLFVNVTLNSA